MAAFFMQKIGGGGAGVEQKLNKKPVKAYMLAIYGFVKRRKREQP